MSSTVYALSPWDDFDVSILPYDWSVKKRLPCRHHPPGIAHQVFLWPWLRWAPRCPSPPTPTPPTNTIKHLNIGTEVLVHSDSQYVMWLTASSIWWIFVENCYKLIKFNIMHVFFFKCMCSFFSYFWITFLSLTFLSITSLFVVSYCLEDKSNNVQLQY